MSRVIALALVVFALAGWVGHGIVHSMQVSGTDAHATVSLTAPEHATPLAKLPDAGRSLGAQTAASSPVDSLGDDAAPLAERRLAATRTAFKAGVFAIGADAVPPAGPLVSPRPRAPPYTPVLPK